MDVTQLTTAQIDAMKQYGVRVVAGVETEPVTIEQARLQLKIVVDDSDEMSPFDAWITQIGLPAAREWCEGYAGLSIGIKTLEMATNGFPSGGIKLLYGPVIGVVSMTYVDTDGAENEMTESDFTYDEFTETVNPAYGLSWPTARDSANSVRIQYQVGYELDSDGLAVLPYCVLAAILLVLGHLDVNREDSSSVVMSQILIGAANFLDQVRTRLGMA